MERLAADVFGGAGGLSLGLHRAGWRMGYACDKSAPACRAHGMNAPTSLQRADGGRALGLLGAPAEIRQPLAYRVTLSPHLRPASSNRHEVMIDLTTNLRTGRASCRKTPAHK